MGNRNLRPEFDGLKEWLLKQGLKMPSLYVNSLLHGEANSDASIEQVLAIAAREVDNGEGIIVKNQDLSRGISTESTNTD